MQQITLAEASQHLSELIEAAINGEEIIIVKDDQPIAKLVPFSLSDFNLLEIKIDYLIVVAKLTLHHREPFDRLLIAQAMVEQIPILSADSAFDAYPIQRLW